METPAERTTRKKLEDCIAESFVTTPTRFEEVSCDDDCDMPHGHYRALYPQCHQNAGLKVLYHRGRLLCTCYFCGKWVFTVKLEAKASSILHP